MDEAVRHDFDIPLYYKRDVIFTHLVVDRVKVVDLDYNVFYIGTSTHTYLLINPPLGNGII